jgi:hypothetical protein
MERDYKNKGRNQWIGDQNNDTMNQREENWCFEELNKINEPLAKLS